MPDSKSIAEQTPTPHSTDRRPRRSAAGPRSRPAQRSNPAAATAPRGEQAPRPAPRPKSQPFASRPLGQTPGPDPDTPLNDVRLVVGTVAGPHGIAGEIKMRIATDDPEQLGSIKRVFIGEETQSRRLLGVRLHKGMALLTISGVTRPEHVDPLRGQPVRISGKDARPLEPGEFYYYQVIGLTAYDESGAVVGTVTDLLETGANDVFVLTPPDGNKEILLPNIPDVVLELAPLERRMVVRPLVYWDAQ